MATVAFTSFLPEVLPHVAGCADVVAVNAVRNACIEFCTASSIWQETQDPITVTPTDLPMTLETVSGAKVSRVLSVRVNGSKVGPATLDELDESQFDWRALVAPAPTSYYLPNPETISFYPMLDSAATVVFRVAYAPLRTASGVEGFVFNDWLEPIAAGAVARLMGTPNQPFSNESLAVVFRDRFEKGITDAAAEANKSYSRAEPRVQMRRFA